MGMQKANSGSGLPRFEEAEPLGPQDAQFVQDLIVVLEKHGNLERFGLCLLHEHFPLAPGEILVETTDTETRTLHAHVEEASRTRHSKPSQWRFLTGVDHSRRAEFTGGPYELVMVCDPYSGCPPRK
ncbi:hypothetical protein ACH4YO_19395 [Streptomyces noursei]|uniref:hypothetical protein n=1 Tax=Streptomyces noursei TaxID=1971 RepID=UPI00081C775B|nr:hypothetical protein SNOUR_11235 [Streptomyces noursei ATCC 11455]MCZ0992828.1 hypothetical protein [Streptomyces noursei]